MAVHINVLLPRMFNMHCSGGGCNDTLSLCQCCAACLLQCLVCLVVVVVPLDCKQKPDAENQHTTATPEQREEQCR